MQSSIEAAIKLPRHLPEADDHGGDWLRFAVPVWMFVVWWFDSQTQAKIDDGRADHIG
jgi:hypothetical protein